MIIKNATTLGTTRTRKDALRIISAGIEAALVPHAMRALTLAGTRLTIQGNHWNLASYEHIYVVGAGKAAASMAHELEHRLGSRITAGIVIDTQTLPLKRIESVKGTHPLTSPVNVNATKKILALVQNAGKNDLIICLISGGGSALLEAPRIPLVEQQTINKLLIKRGASIKEINTVRKHLSFVKGGQLAALAAPATLITLIISDVMTNELQFIASGPTVYDSTTKADAHRVLKKYNIRAPALVETPKRVPQKTTNLLLATNHSSAEAMQRQAQQLGYKAHIQDIRLKGEAREVGKALARLAKPGQALIFAGETTVTVTGTGVGGRNQELTLAAAPHLKQGVIASCSTDGVDFITQAAGGIVDASTTRLAQRKKLSLADYLAQNDSYHALKKLNGLIKTGKTGTNIGDLILVLGDKISLNKRTA